MKRIFLLFLFILTISGVRAQSNITYYDTLYNKDFFCYLNYEDDTLLTGVDANEKFMIQLVQKRGKGENLYRYNFSVNHSRGNRLLSSVEYFRDKINQQVEYQSRNLRPGDQIIILYEDEMAVRVEDKYVKSFYIQSTKSSMEGKRKIKVQFYYGDQLIGPADYTLQVTNVSQYKFTNGLLEIDASQSGQIEALIKYKEQECAVSIFPTCDIYNGILYAGLIPEYKKFRATMYTKLKLYDKTKAELEALRVKYPYLEVLEEAAYSEKGYMRYSIMWDNDKNDSCGSTISQPFYE